MERKEWYIEIDTNFLPNYIFLKINYIFKKFSVLMPYWSMAPILSFSEVRLVMGLLLISSAAAFDGRAQVYCPGQMPGNPEWCPPQPCHYPFPIPCQYPCQYTCPNLVSCNCRCQYPYHSSFCYNYCYQGLCLDCECMPCKLSRTMAVMSKLD